MRRAIRLRFAMLLLALSAVAWPVVAQKLPLASASPPVAPKLRIGFVAALANAPVLIADAEGLFARQGVAVELKPFGDGPLIQQAMASGQLDVAYVGAPPVYQWFARGLDMRIVAKVNEGQAAIVAKAGSGIVTMADLKGRRLAGVSRGSGMDVLLRGFVLKQSGLLPDTDLQLLQMPVANMNAALDTGAVDAAFEWEPFISQAVLRGTGKVVLDAGVLLPHYPWYVIAVPATVLHGRGAEIEMLLRAHSQAIAFLNAQPDAANRIVATRLAIAPVRDLAGRTVAPEAIVAEARRRVVWAGELTPPDRAFIQSLMDASLALGFLARPLKAADVIDTTVWTRAIAGLR